MTRTVRKVNQKHLCGIPCFTMQIMPCYVFNNDSFKETDFRDLTVLGEVTVDGKYFFLDIQIIQNY